MDGIMIKPWALQSLLELEFYLIRCQICFISLFLGKFITNNFFYYTTEITRKQTYIIVSFRIGEMMFWPVQISRYCYYGHSYMTFLCNCRVK